MTRLAELFAGYGDPQAEHETHVREVMGWDDEEDEA